MKSMKPRHLAALLALTVSRPAAAESHKLLVLQSEGRVDPTTRSKIDAAIFKLAAAAEPQAVAGELNFSDAAVAVGCKPETPLCKDEVLGMLSVDEIVVTTLAPKPGGLEITVRRLGKGGAAREAAMLLPAGTPPDKLAGIAPLFGGQGSQGGPGPGTPTGPALATTEHRAIEHPANEHPINEHPANDRPVTEHPVVPAPTPVAQEPTPSPAVTSVSSEHVTAQPQDEPGTRRRPLEIAGMAGGAAITTLGLVLWAAASGVQSDIDGAPTATRQELQHLKDLESKGDGYAKVGNLLVVTGVIVGGLATAFYIKDRYTGSGAAQARLTPAVFDHGAGLVLTIGGTP